MESLSPEPTSVYRYYDKFGVLLYVGITSRGIRRNREHNATKEWWPLVARQTVDHFADRKSALEHERHLIQKFHPPFNKHHNPDHAEMRELYYAQGHVVAKLRPTEYAVSKSARTLLGLVGHALPLMAVSRDPGGGVYAASKKHAALAEAVDWRPGITFRTRTHKGIVKSVETVDGRRLFRVDAETNNPLPANIILKLRVDQDPYCIYAWEATAA